MRRRWIYLVPLIVLGFLIFVAIGGVVVQRLWNWLLPGLFGWHAIGFWQALGLLALCRILFGGLGCHARHHPRWRPRIGERWEQMTPEERERFRRGMRATPTPE